MGKSPAVTEQAAAHQEREYLRRRDACRYLGVSLRCLSDLQRKHKLPFLKLGRRLVLFKRTDLDQWLEQYRLQSV